MKLNGILGKASGKLGSAVFATQGGQQVVRQYQPNVKNPNTEAQTMQRARFKLMTQLSSSYANVIAIPRSGSQTSRNLFVKKNMPLVIGTADGAQVVYENLQLTNGTRALPGIHVTRDGGSLKIELVQSPSSTVNRVAYCAFSKDSEGQLALEKTIIVSVAGEGGTFPTTIDNVDADLIFYAYGMIDGGASATANFENYHVDSATDLAKLISSRKLSLTDYQMTKTRGTTLQADENENVFVPTGSYGLYVNVNRNSTVDIYVNDTKRDVASAGSSFASAFPAGSRISLRAVAGELDVFDGWYDQNTGERLSTSAQFDFNLTKKYDVLAKFASTGGSEDPLG